MKNKTKLVRPEFPQEPRKPYFHLTENQKFKTEFVKTYDLFFEKDYSGSDCDCEECGAEHDGCAYELDYKEVNFQEIIDRLPNDIALKDCTILLGLQRSEAHYDDGVDADIHISYKLPIDFEKEKAKYESDLEKYEEDLKNYKRNILPEYDRQLKEFLKLEEKENDLKEKRELEAKLAKINARLKT